MAVVMLKDLCTIVVALAILSVADAFVVGLINAWRSDRRIRQYVRRQWHAKLSRGGIAFEPGDRVRARRGPDEPPVDNEGGVGTVVGEATIGRDEWVAYWVLFDSFRDEFGDRARPLLMAPCELEYVR